MGCVRIQPRHVVAIGVVACMVTVARSGWAQSPPPASEETFDITVSVPAPAGVESTQNVAPEPMPPVSDEEDEGDDDETVTVTRAPAVAAAEARRREVEALWRRHLGVGLTAGVGSPIGMFGVFAEGDFHPAFGLTFGGGAGGTFGPSIAVGAITRPFRFGPFAPFAAASFSTNFTPAQYRSDPSLSAPANSYWINLELGGELRLARGFALRLGVGWAIMLNTGDFTNQQVGAQYGPLSNVDVGWDPVSAADSHDEGHALGFPFVHLDAVYYLPF